VGTLACPGCGAAGLQSGSRWAADARKAVRLRYYREPGSLPLGLGGGLEVPPPILERRPTKLCQAPGDNCKPGCPI